MPDIKQITLPDGNTYDFRDSNAVKATSSSLGLVKPDNRTITVDADGVITSNMVILSYGSSTWADFLAAYTSKSVVYCRASSNSNPASGSQTRMAFMAYVNNAENPTNVEFQYYRSIATHSATQQGDQVFVYKLDKNSGWSVTTREAVVKIAAGNNMTQSYSNGTLTLNSTASGSTVSVTQIQSTGTQIATVTVDGIGTDLYAPSGGTPTAMTEQEVADAVDAGWGILYIASKVPGRNDPDISNFQFYRTCGDAPAYRLSDPDTEFSEGETVYFSWANGQTVTRDDTQAVLTVTTLDQYTFSFTMPDSDITATLDGPR